MIAGEGSSRASQDSRSVSVVIPCYNGSALLPETLRSAIGQTVRPLEILVVDDGSTDESAAVAEGFGPPVRVIRQANQGESAARNRGIAEARGGWIAFLDADDLWEPQKLERQLAAAEPGVTCVHTNYYYFGQSEGTADLSAEPAETRYRLERVAVDPPFRISSVMVRRGLPVRFPEWTQYAEDLVYFLELALRAKIRLVPETLTGYRVHAKGQSADPRTVLLRCRTVERWLAEHGGAVSPEMQERIRRGWVALLADTARAARYRRNWPEYWSIRRFLAARRPDHPVAEALVRERVYPRWLYALKDAWDGLVARSGRP